MYLNKEVDIKKNWCNAKNNVSLTRWHIAALTLIPRIVKKKERCYRMDEKLSLFVFTQYRPLAKTVPPPPSNLFSSVILVFTIVYNVHNIHNYAKIRNIEVGMFSLVQFSTCFVLHKNFFSRITQDEARLACLPKQDATEYDFNWLFDVPDKIMCTKISQTHCTDMRHFVMMYWFWSFYILLRRGTPMVERGNEAFSWPKSYKTLRIELNFDKAPTTFYILLNTT